jgi:hypothetical protein
LSTILYNNSKPILGKMAYNVPAVYDGLAARISKTAGFAGAGRPLRGLIAHASWPANCGWSFGMGMERNEMTYPLWRQSRPEAHTACYATHRRIPIIHF